MGNLHTASPNVEVGIMTVPGLSFRLSGKYTIAGNTDAYYDLCTAKIENSTIVVSSNLTRRASGRELIFLPCNLTADHFVLHDVVIGIDFHWEQKENQRFQGALKLKLVGDRIAVINILPVEDYLKSVISSEMNASASPELLKAHAIIARSWLLAKLEGKDAGIPEKEQLIAADNPEEYIRWWDSGDHENFTVCADDHCQRYQGISRMSNPHVAEAVNQTSGQVLKYDGVICDTRYSKACGGKTEVFSSCWGDREQAYLKSFPDVLPLPVSDPDLSNEVQAGAFIHGSPECFCNTSDEKVLSQVLNDYDLKTRDYFRWKVSYTNQEISELIKTKSGHDFGPVRSLIPVKRGPSGRLILLNIVGTKKSMTIGKELLIRKWLSPSHLYSSAFIVKEGKPDENGVP
ncbi:MAG: SpoIID/LytB domain-containing protein, partial [Bacteroidota bacterium]